MALEEVLDGPASAEPRHSTQLFDDRDSRAAAVSAFLATGWRAGDTLLVVASAFHWVAISHRLEARGVPVVDAIESGRLVVRDAHQTLAGFLHHEQLDEHGFHATVGDLVRTLAARGPRVRIFGEMVDLLAGSGDYAGAEHLEALWNGLAEREPFVLFCGYSASTFGDPRSRAALRRICAAHEHVHTNPDDLLGSFLIDASRRRPLSED
jgi:hypothetical protein